MFWLLAAYAVVPHFDTLTVLMGEVQPEVEEWVQEETYDKDQERKRIESLKWISDVVKVRVWQQLPHEMIVHNWYSNESIIQEYVKYAYKLWWIDFVKLIECENGTWNPYRVSPTHDHWLCQLNYYYNKDFINSPDFSDPYKQLDYCYEKFKINPDLWYWPSRKIRWKKCSDYVSDRFEIVAL